MPDTTSADAVPAFRKVIVDGQEADLQADLNLLQALEEAGNTIPRFCYHERLSVAGNCRMCLVELVGAPKPAASCHMLVSDLRGGPDGQPPAVNTQSELVEKARNGVMEFLLINHPLDCPICDQGGECDLQDQALYYGRDRSRYEENKRAVEDKEMGPLIKTIMTRCIQCTRCVRFATEIAGVPELGAAGRGEAMEITTYLEGAMQSELSGNVIDLCPVGALTSKPYAFNARPWELRKTDSIDVMDAMGSAIRLDTRGGAVMRILPRENENINQEWISDKSRFVWDGLARQRLDRPFIRQGGQLRPGSWEEALDKVVGALKIPSDKIGMVAGDLMEMEAIKAAKDLADALGITSIDARQRGEKIETMPRQARLFNSGFAGIESADAILLIGCNPRIEAAVLNARIRRAWLENDCSIAMIGPETDLTYPYVHLGDQPQDLEKLVANRDFRDVLKRAKRPAIILGVGALCREDGAEILQLAGQLADKVGLIDDASGWNGFNILHCDAAFTGALDLGFLPSEGGKNALEMVEAVEKGDLQTLILIGADALPLKKSGNCQLIYLGHHGDRSAQIADIILPIAAYTEMDGSWTNAQGDLQHGLAASPLKGEARPAWKIFRKLAQLLGKELPYNKLEQLRDAMRGDLTAAGIGMTVSEARAETRPILLTEIGNEGKVSALPFVSIIANFYQSNVIARASKTLQKCATTHVQASTPNREKASAANDADAFTASDKRGVK